MRRQSLGIIAALLTFALGVSVATFRLVRREPTAAATPKAEAIKVGMPEPPAPPPAQTQPPKYLKAIEIVSHDEEYALVETPSLFEDLSAETITVDLALGESIEGQHILLHVMPGFEAHELKIEQRFETSVTVMDEGPHVDLTEWKHYRSKWQEIRKVAKNKFLTSDVGEEGYTKFPKVTSEEIYKAVLKETKGWDAADRKWWLGQARKCKGPNDDPCAVSVSKISFRIKVREGGEWKVVKLMEFLVPMGC